MKIFEQKDDGLINYECVCRTAPATLGLLIREEEDLLIDSPNDDAVCRAELSYARSANNIKSFTIRRKFDRRNIDIISFFETKEAQIFH